MITISIAAIALLNKVASELKRLAVENRCLIVTINHASNSPERTPFLGRYWLHVPNVRLHSKRLSANEFQLTVVANVYNPVDKTQCIFRLPQITIWRHIVLDRLKSFFLTHLHIKPMWAAASTGNIKWFEWFPEAGRNSTFQTKMIYILPSSLNCD